MFEVEGLGNARSAVKMHWGVKIPMRDGVELNATVYLPRARQEPAPAIVTLTPYTGQLWHDFGVYFAGHGYPFLAVDVRGRGNSGGVFKPLCDVARDGYDAVEWIAKQPYCNGRVAMWGGSYAAYAQWSVAAHRPPHLATIVPVAPCYLGVDFPGRSNILPAYLMQWLTLVSGRTLQDRLFFNSERYWGARFREWFESGTPFQQLDEFLGNPSASFQEWISHPEVDAYWDGYNPTAQQYAGLSIPVLTITGSYDDDQPGSLMHYQQHRKHAPAGVEHYLVIGPWDHFGTRTPKQEFCGLKFGPESLLDLPELHREWYAWTLQGGARPRFLRDKVAYYLMGAEKWCYASSLEAITARVESLYLHSEGNPDDVFKSGSLLRERDSCSGGPDQYVHDPRDVALAELESTVDPESRADQRMIHAAVGRELIYHTEPFERDVPISGFFKLAVWLAIDQPDTDFRARVYEIRLDGSSVLLSSDIMRARYRESLREAVLVETRDPMLYNFEHFVFVSRLISKGSRLRLVIGPLHSIYWQKNFNSGGTVSAESVNDSRPVTVRLFHDPTYRSVLYVPIGRLDESCPSR
jgi:putative CocE/NonD family hydrolase